MYGSRTSAWHLQSFTLTDDMMFQKITTKSTNLERQQLHQGASN
jgi:hypothetical protein